MTSSASKLCDAFPYLTQVYTIPAYSAILATKVYPTFQVLIPGCCTSRRRFRVTCRRAGCARSSARCRSPWKGLRRMLPSTHPLYVARIYLFARASREAHQRLGRVARSAVGMATAARSRSRCCGKNSTAAKDRKKRAPSFVRHAAISGSTSSPGQTYLKRERSNNYEDGIGEAPGGPRSRPWRGRRFTSESRRLGNQEEFLKFSRSSQAASRHSLLRIHATQAATTPRIVIPW